jgi:hypothetical protein
MYRPGLSAALAAQATSVRRVRPDIAAILPQLRACKYQAALCRWPSPRPLEIAELSQSPSAAVSARNQDRASRTRYEQDLNFMITLHDCPLTRCGRAITVGKNPRLSCHKLNTAHGLLHDGIHDPTRRRADPDVEVPQDLYFPRNTAARRSTKDWMPSFMSSLLKTRSLILGM